jgi:hypothetical protein
MAFNGFRRSKTYKQINMGSPEMVFPLLCPVREKDWIDGWDYKMIFSKSGLIEKGCVFSTSHHGSAETIWYVTDHDPSSHRIQFLRVTPNEEVVKIDITLSDNGNGTTTSLICYQYTGLTESKNQWIGQELDSEFEKNMVYWEKAINHFLQNGIKLLK